MDLFCLGLSHHTADVSLRERFAVPEADVVRFLGSLCSEGGAGECVLLSTCNRVEVYAACKDAGVAAEACASLLRGQAGVAADFYRFDGMEAARHLIRVAAGLDSMVLGETEILGQVKDAYAMARGAGTTGPVLNRLFQHGFRAAKEVRSSTGITRGAVSVGAAAGHLAVRSLGSLGGCRALLLGAGEAGTLVAHSLRARGVRDLVVTNRTPARAVQLAAELGGRSVDFGVWRELLPGLDIVVACAAAPARLLSAADLAPVMAARPGRPLFVLDLAVPRDFDPAIRELPGVDWHDVDSLRSLAREGRTRRALETLRGEKLASGRAAEFMRRLKSGVPLAVAA
jgi:glutamyl-tRNA reductase